MSRLIFRGWLSVLVAAAVLAACGSVRAQFRGQNPADAELDPEATRKLVGAIDEKALAKPPEREFKVEMGPAQETKLFRADPKLLENKFLARTALVVTSEEVGETRNLSFSTSGVPIAISEFVYAVRELPQGAKRLIDGRSGGQTSIFSGVEMSQFSYRQMGLSPVPPDAAIATLSDYFKLLSQLCPKELLPPQTAIDFLTSPDAIWEVYWESGAVGNPSNRRAWYITVYAPTEELAEQRIRAMIQLWDNGLCRPLQRDCLTEAKKSLQSVQQGYDEVNKLTAAITAKEELLANPSEINSDILSQLRAQKVMVGIELAGLNARVKACNEMLKEVRDDTRPPSQVHNSIADMKVRAEVELVGSKEKLDRINSLIAEGNGREALRAEIDRIKKAKQGLQQQIDRQHQRRAEAYARLVSLYAPLEIKDNKITITPVMWTN